MPYANYAFEMFATSPKSNEIMIRLWDNVLSGHAASIPQIHSTHKPAIELQQPCV